MKPLSCDEVAEQIRKAIYGAIDVRLADPEDTWDNVFAGTCYFWFGDWKIGIFNDCDSIDYVDLAESPDGRRGDFDDWVDEFNGRDYCNHPLWRFNAEETDKLERLLKEAK